MTRQLTDDERKAISKFVSENQTLPRKADLRSSNKLKRQKSLQELHDSGVARNRMREALEAFGFHVSESTITGDLQALGLTAPRRPAGSIDGKTISQVKKDRAQRKAAKLRDRRRFKTTPVPFGAPAVIADKDATGPIFPDRVFTPDGSEPVLKDGCNNAKIGGDVLVGRLKGARIATLTLPERSTCPTSCPLWTGCYGNTMHYARRFEPGQMLEDQIGREVTALCNAHELVLIRLHVLGDFYSEKYVDLWSLLLEAYPNLNIFGFTAWPTDTPIGTRIDCVRKAFPDRFMIRNSGKTGIWGSFTLPFPTEAKTIGDAIVCPEQLDAMKGSPEARHCGNCAACWSTDRPIAFVEH